MSVRKQYSKEELEGFKKDLIEYNLFKYMDRQQQAELIQHWEKQFSISELSELFGVRTNSIYALKKTLQNQGHLPKSDKKQKRKRKSSAKQEKSVAIKSEKITEADMETAEAWDNPAPPKQIENVQRLVPLEYMQQVIENQVQVLDPAGNDLNVSLEEFMKMLEIQEKMAKMMEEQTNRNTDGFQFKFKGDFSSEDLTKRLNKVLAIVEGEPMRYAVKFELYELEEDEKTEDQTEVENELLEEVNALQESMKDMQKQLEQQKQAEKKVDWKAGYNALQNTKKGLHHQRSEYEKAGDFTGTIQKDGRTLYQTFYICECGHKGKHYLENGTIYANCSECGKRMRIRPAVKNGKLKQDTFGNFFIAGKFKRADEIDQDKPLFEVWGAN